MIVMNDNSKYIVDKCGAFSHLKNDDIFLSNKEQCLIACARKHSESTYYIVDYCNCIEFGCESDDLSLIIPLSTSYAFLLSCKKMNAVPVIMHTHCSNSLYFNPLKFSQQDELFMESLMDFAFKHFGITECISIISDGTKTLEKIYKCKEVL